MTLGKSCSPWFWGCLTAARIDPDFPSGAFPAITQECLDDGHRSGILLLQLCLLDQQPLPRMLTRFREWINSSAESGSTQSCWRKEAGLVVLLISFVNPWDILLLKLSSPKDILYKFLFYCTFIDSRIRSVLSALFVDIRWSPHILRLQTLHQAKTKDLGIYEVIIPC